MKITTPHVALVVSLASLIFTGLGFRNQRRESEMQLWTSIRREFDYDLRRDRKLCGQAYAAGSLESHYGPVMDYFESLGFLVHSGRLSPDLFDNTWGPFFSGYFQATKPFMEAERKRDARIYEEVYYLARKFPTDPSLQTPEDLKEFFGEEGKLADR